MKMTLGVINIVLLAVFGSFGCGCTSGPRKWHYSADNRQLPDDWSQAVVPLGQERATRKLDPNSLYVDGQGGDWFRFWARGQVIESSSRLPVTTAEADDFHHSGAGFYSIVGDRITMEFITPNEDWPFGPPMKYDYYKGRMNDDGSFTVEMPSGPSFFYGIGVKPRYQTYRPVRTEGMQRQPDW